MMDIQDMMNHDVNNGGQQNFDDVVDDAIKNVSVLQQNVPEDSSNNEQHFEELRQFYKQFTQRIIVFDPLDRPIPDEENDEATKNADLIKMLNEMPAVFGFALNAPMSKEKSVLLDKMFERELQLCNKIGQDYQEQAQKMGTEFSLDISAHPKIVTNLKIRQFFEQYKLIENADVLQSRFEYQIKKMSQLIELQKNFMKSNQVGQTILKYQRDIFRRKIEKNY